MYCDVATSVLEGKQIKFLFPLKLMSLNSLGVYCEEEKILFFFSSVSKPFF